MTAADTGFIEATFSWFLGLEEHNDSALFAAHRDAFTDPVDEPFTPLLEAVAARLSTTSGSTETSASARTGPPTTSTGQACGSPPRQAWSQLARPSYRPPEAERSCTWQVAHGPVNLAEEHQMHPLDRFERVEVMSRQGLHDWLLVHHARDEAVWLVTSKKAVAHRYVPRADILDELVAFGWIDGVRRRIDDERTRQLVSPRRVQPWAKSYKDRAERLIRDGLMQPSGQAGVDRARASGDWDAMNDVDALLVPADLAEALAHQPPAQPEFDAFPPSARRNILRWIASARNPLTRSRRIDATVQEARGGRRVKSHG